MYIAVYSGSVLITGIIFPVKDNIFLTGNAGAPGNPGYPAVDQNTYTRYSILAEVKCFLISS